MRLSEFGLKDKLPHSVRVPLHEYKNLDDAIGYLLDCYKKKKLINVDGPTTLNTEPNPYKVAFMVVYIHLYKNVSFESCEDFSDYCMKNSGDKIITTSNMPNDSAMAACKELTTRDMMLIRRGEYLNNCIGGVL